MDITFFGKTSQHEEVYSFKLKNINGIEVTIINFGATITSIKTSDKNNVFKDIVLGYDNLSQYINDDFYLGSTVGRFANRISKGKFKINDIEYSLPVNNGINHIHGGLKGFNKVIWSFKDISYDNIDSLELSYYSPDGEEGYPGNLENKVIYILNNANELIIKYISKSDKDTIVNLTNHSYFNLNNSDNILKHDLIINSKEFTPINENMIPKGKIEYVKNTPLDFTLKKAIGKDINDNYNQLVLANGYDHNFIIQKDKLNPKNNLNFAARLSEITSKRFVEIYTTKPGLQFYSGNFLENIKGKNGKIYNKHSGLCLETQYYPDSPNQHNFPDTILKSGEEYNHTTIYKFGVF